jgi:hypothetical protein
MAYKSCDYKVLVVWSARGLSLLVVVVVFGKVNHRVGQV